MITLSRVVVGLILRTWLKCREDLDDVVVKDVSMFRAEMLSPDHLWLACYLSETGVDGDRISFEVNVDENGHLRFDVVEHPTGRVATE